MATLMPAGPVEDEAQPPPLVAAVDNATQVLTCVATALQSPSMGTLVMTVPTGPTPMAPDAAEALPPAQQRAAVKSCFYCGGDCSVGSRMFSSTLGYFHPRCAPGAAAAAAAAPPAGAGASGAKRAASQRGRRPRQQEGLPDAPAPVDALASPPPEKRRRAAATGAAAEADMPLGAQPQVPTCRACRLPCLERQPRQRHTDGEYTHVVCPSAQAAADAERMPPPPPRPGRRSQVALAEAHTVAPPVQPPPLPPPLPSPSPPVVQDAPSTPAGTVFALRWRAAPPSKAAVLATLSPQARACLLRHRCFTRAPSDSPHSPFPTGHQLRRVLLQPRGQAASDCGWAGVPSVGGHSSPRRVLRRR